MIEWTETARRTLDEYCARSRTVLAGTGADENEVADDLRRHVEEEIRAAGLTVVTEEQIRRILSRLGEPAAASESRQRTVSGIDWGAGGRALLILFGAVLPLGTLVFELVTGMSSGVLVNPLPTWLHVVAVALVPVANIWIWRAARGRDSRHAKLLGWLNGIALGVCTYYGVVYLLFAPIAVIGLLYFGLGLIPLSPYFALISTAILRGQYARAVGRPLSGGGKGALLAVFALLLFQVPLALTYYGLARASSDDYEEKMSGVRLLRAVGDEDLILRSAYGLLRRELDLDMVRWFAMGDRTIAPEAARETYYRVTGQPFNSVPPPALFTRAGRWTLLEEEFTWDDALGGERVAGRVKGLSLFSSRMDAVAEPDSAVVYCEWTLEFKNVSGRQREARAQIALPPGGVVSRLTLWIDGEEREAAFGGRTQVRAAYQEVAVQQRRDPVLVTTCGPDRVLMQCFPVPAHGIMKVRVGITAPLVLHSVTEGKFVWPSFLERNFGIGPDLRHGLWLQSPGRLTAQGGSVSPGMDGDRPFAFQRSLAESVMTDAAQSITVHRPADVTNVWTPSESGNVIRQSIRASAVEMPQRLVLMLDGSAGMREVADEVIEALANVPAETEIALVIASDRTREFTITPAAATTDTLNRLRQELRRARFVGGQDNLSALEAAWDAAAAVENGVVVWIHLPEPELLSSESGLRQRLEWRSNRTRLCEIQVRNGPDRVIEKLDGLSALERVPYSGSVRNDLEQMFSRWSGRVPVYELVRERVSGVPLPAGEPRVSRHIERLWARDEALQLTSKRRRDDAARIAVKHQLVTPVSGAVVLETQQQYERHGLAPVDATTVPAIPEPQTGALLLMGFGLWAWLRRRRARGG